MYKRVLIALLICLGIVVLAGIIITVIDPTMYTIPGGGTGGYGRKTVF